MTTEIKLVTLRVKLEAQPRKNVNCAYMVNIGGVVKLFKSDSSAHRWLKKMGYNLNEDCRTYTKKYESEQERELDRKYEVFNPTN